MISKLLVVESLPKPINYTGGMDPLSYGRTFTLEREMVRYGILNDQPAPDATIDPYALDRAYWHSFHPTTVE